MPVSQCLNIKLRKYLSFSIDQFQRRHDKIDLSKGKHKNDHKHKCDSNFRLSKFQLLKLLTHCSSHVPQVQQRSHKPGRVQSFPQTDNVIMEGTTAVDGWLVIFVQRKHLKEYFKDPFLQATSYFNILFSSLFKCLLTTRLL